MVTEMRQHSPLDKNPDILVWSP